MIWDEWRGSLDGRPVMFVKRLFAIGRYCVDLHKFVRADDRGCFHTHPAPALRVILWGGYAEELEDGQVNVWFPLEAGIVRPALSHRVTSLLGRPSYSLWIRGPKCADVQLRGPGWPAGPVTLSPGQAERLAQLVEEQLEKEAEQRYHDEEAER